MVIFENIDIDIDIDKAIPKISILIWWFWKISISILISIRSIREISILISISTWWFWKISISIRQFCKISISIIYRIDSNLAYRTGLGGGEGAVAVNFAFSLFIFVWRILLLNRSATTWRQATNNWRAWKTQNSRLPPTKGQSNPDSSNNVHIVGDLFPGSEMPAVMFIFLIDLGLPTRSLSLDLI